MRDRRRDLLEEPEDHTPKYEVTCGKRGFKSRDAARRSMVKASFRVRVYQCDQCGLFHIANAEKS